MKKLVIFTVVMVLALAGAAFAVLDENAVAVLDSQAASTGGENTAIDAQGNPVAVNGSQAATNGGTNVDVEAEDFLNNKSVNDNSNQNNLYIVDNAVLANVNVQHDSTLGVQVGVNTFNKTQESNINGFNGAVGVSNVNSAAGNLNSQSAATSIKVKF